MTAAADGCEREADGRVPSLRRKGPGFVIARPARRLVVAIRNPVPFFHVFKWQFENTVIFNSQFSIRPERGQWRSMTAATGLCEREGERQWRAMLAAAGRCEREAGGEPSLRPRRIENRIKADQGRKSGNQNTRSVRRPGPQAGPAFFCVSAPWQAAPERWRPGGPAFPNQENFFCRSVNLFALFSVL